MFQFLRPAPEDAREDRVRSSRWRSHTLRVMPVFLSKGLYSSSTIHDGILLNGLSYPWNGVVHRGAPAVGKPRLVHLPEVIPKGKEHAERALALVRKMSPEQRQPLSVPLQRRRAEARVGTYLAARNIHVLHGHAPKLLLWYTYLWSTSRGVESDNRCYEGEEKQMRQQLAMNSVARVSPKCIGLHRL